MNITNEAYTSSTRRGICWDAMSITGLLLTGYDAWNRGDRAAWLELLDPEIEIETSGVFPDLAPDYRGRERAGKFWDQMLEPWDEFHIEVERIEEEGDVVAAGIRFRARGEDSGVEVDMRFGMGMLGRDGLGIRFITRSTFDEARQAVRAERPEHAESR